MEERNDNVVVNETTSVSSEVTNDIKPVVESDDVVKTSGTATEEEIVIDASQVKEDVLDEDEIKRHIKVSKETSKKNTYFIILVFALLGAFVFILPQILKIIGVI